MNYGEIVKMGCTVAVWVEIAALIVRLVTQYLRYRLQMAEKNLRKPSDEKRGS